MSLENNIITYNFNKETLHLLQEEGYSENELIATMETVGFSIQLTLFLLSVSPVFYNSIMVRLKLYAKQHKDVNYVKTALKNFEETFVLIDHLFFIGKETVMVEKHVEEPVETHVKENVMVEKYVVEPVETHVKENFVELLEEVVENKYDNTDTDTDSDVDTTPLETFYDKYIVKEEGAKLSSKTTYDFFVDWYTENHNGEMPDKKEFKKYLSEKLGKSNKNSWNNYTLNATH